MEAAVQRVVELTANEVDALRMTRVASVVEQMRSRRAEAKLREVAREWA